MFLDFSPSAVKPQSPSEIIAASRLRTQSRLKTLVLSAQQVRESVIADLTDPAVQKGFTDAELQEIQDCLDRLGELAGLSKRPQTESPIAFAGGVSPAPLAVDAVGG